MTRYNDLYFKNSLTLDIPCDYQSEPVRTRNNLSQYTHFRSQHKITSLSHNPIFIFFNKMFCHWVNCRESEIENNSLIIPGIYFQLLCKNVWFLLPCKLFDLKYTFFNGRQIVLRTHKVSSIVLIAGDINDLNIDQFRI